MENLPTAEELMKRDESGIHNEVDIAKLMRDFAKLHVKAALEAAAKNAKVETRTYGSQFAGDWKKVVDRESILNSYLESNIK